MNVVRNNRGFTLAELVVASAICVVLTLVATFAFSMAMSVFVRAARLTEAETEMLSALYAIKSTYAQSVNVVYGGDTGTASAITDANGYDTRSAASAEDVTKGKIYTTNFNSTTPVASSPQTYLISLTVREMNTGYNSAAANAPNSLFYGTGVYFQTPTFTRSGALYIDQENNAGTGSPSPGGWVATSPIQATQAYARFTEFHVENVNVLKVDNSTATASSGDASTVDRPVLSAQFRLIMRYFTSGSTGNPTAGMSGDWRWCPASFMYQTTSGTAASVAGCDNAKKRASYKDIEKKVKVVFSNNAYNRDKYLSERPNGYVYFFKSWAPTAGRAQ